MEDLSKYNPEGSELRRAQMKMLEMLDVFHEICERNSIPYWLVCGTLLGARRHGGFIPWDDDLDVAVLQSDYNRLVSALKKELPADLKLQSRETDKYYWYYYLKIRDTRSRFYNKNAERDYFEHKGIFIDIFPLEPVPSIGIKNMVKKLLMAEVNIKTTTSIYYKIKFALMVATLPVIRLGIRLSRFYYKHLSNKKIYTDAYGVFWTPKYNMEYFFPAGEIMFEGKKYKAPSKVDQYLTDHFGPDFMQLPNVEDRKTHSSKIEFF